MCYCFPLVEILDSRQKKAETLKRMTDNAVRMSEEQLVELRADIKVHLLYLLKHHYKKKHKGGTL